MKFDLTHGGLIPATINPANGGYTATTDLFQQASPC